MMFNFGGNESLFRIDLSYWYKTGETIHPLTEISGDVPLREIWPQLFFAHQRLEDLISSNRLHSSFAHAVELLNTLNRYMNREDFDATVSNFETHIISSNAQKFETTFNAELSVAPSYIITPKGAYDVNILTLAPNMAFPSELSDLVPEAKYDMKEAARCIAFEVSAAAAFHLHRLNEVVVHRYWDAVSNGAVRPARNGLGEYIGALDKAKKGDDKVIATLKQINTLHRNPIIHSDIPSESEKEYNIWEAIGLLGIIVSVVYAMLPAIAEYQKKADSRSEEEESTSSSVVPLKP